MKGLLTQQTLTACQRPNTHGLAGPRDTETNASPLLLRRGPGLGEVLRNVVEISGLTSCVASRGCVFPAHTVVPGERRSHAGRQSPGRLPGGGGRTGSCSEIREVGALSAVNGKVWEGPQPRGTQHTHSLPEAEVTRLAGKQCPPFWPRPPPRPTCRPCSKCGAGTGADVVPSQCC